MKIPFQIDHNVYTLYKAFPDTNVEHVIRDSLTYNDGIDYFDGSDCTTATVFLVAKGKVSLFVQELESFIQVIMDAEMRERFDGGDLIDLTDYLNFAVLHKNIDDSHFDFFVTNFMFD